MTPLDQIQKRMALMERRLNYLENSTKPVAKEKWLTPSQVFSIYGKSEATLRRYRMAKKFTKVSCDVKGHYKYPASECERLFNTILKLA